MQKNLFSLRGFNRNISSKKKKLMIAEECFEVIFRPFRSYVQQNFEKFSIKIHKVLTSLKFSASLLTIGKNNIRRELKKVFADVTTFSNFFFPSHALKQIESLREIATWQLVLKMNRGMPDASWFRKQTKLPRRGAIECSVRQFCSMRVNLLIIINRFLMFPVLEIITL